MSEKYNFSNNIKKYIDFKSLIKLILIFILFYFSNLLQYIPIILFKIDIENISSTTNILLNLFSNLCVLIILLIIYRKELINNFIKFKNNFFKMFDTSLKYYLLGMLGMIITNLVITVILQGNGSNNEKIVQEMINTTPYLMLINAGLIGPIIEEIVFRKTYLDAFKNKYLCIILSGVVFGLMHVISSANTIIEYLYFIPYTALGLSFIYMDYKENNIYPSILMHIIHNSLLVIISII